VKRASIRTNSSAPSPRKQLRFLSTTTDIAAIAPDAAIAGRLAQQFSILRSRAFPFDDELALPILQLRIVDVHPAFDNVYAVKRGSKTGASVHDPEGTAAPATVRNR